MEAVCFGLVGHQRREQQRQPDRLRAELPADRRAVAGIEDEIDGGEHGAEPLRQQMLRRHAEGNARVADLPFRTDQPLRERRLRDDERARDLGRRQAAHQAEGQRDLRIGCERRMAAREDQLESLVGNHCVLVAGKLLDPSEQLRLACERLLAPDPVDRAVARRRHDPGAGVRRHAVTRPALGSDEERVLHRVLGEIEIAENAAEDCDATCTLVAVGTGEVVYSRYSELSCTGRISTFPVRAAGIRDAHSIASSSESASIR